MPKIASERPEARKGDLGLLIVAGVVGVATVVAIGFALGGSGGAKNGGAPGPVTTTPPAVVLQPTTATVPPPPPATTPGEVPPLVNTVTPYQGPGKPPYNGADCERARVLRKLGHPKEAESWALSCISRGGNPN